MPVTFCATDSESAPREKKNVGAKECFVRNEIMGPLRQFREAPAVDEQRGASNEPRVVRGEKADRSG